MVAASRAALGAAVAGTAAAIASGCGGGGQGTAPPTGGPPVAAAAVHISNYTYRPAVVAVRPGGTVTWTNDDNAPHTATVDRRRAFETGTLRRRDSKPIVLTRAGTYSYHCTFHRFMVARVVVR